MPSGASLELLVQPVEVLTGEVTEGRKPEGRAMPGLQCAKPPPEGLGDLAGELGQGRRLLTQDEAEDLVERAVSVADDDGLLLRVVGGEWPPVAARHQRPGLETTLRQEARGDHDHLEATLLFDEPLGTPVGGADEPVEADEAHPHGLRGHVAFIVVDRGDDALAPEADAIGEFGQLGEPAADHLLPHVRR